MRNLINRLLILLLGLSLNISANPYTYCQEKEPSWFTCEKNSDCIIISNPCGHPTAASNKKFSDRAENCNIQRGASLGCVSWNVMGSGKSEAICKNYVCSTRSLLPERFPPNCQIKENLKWYTCEKDADCTFVSGACKNIAVALKFKKQAGGYYSCQAARANCSGSPSRNPKLKCIQKTCKIEN